MSFSHRYLITLLSSVIRAGLNFFVSVSVAKYFMPELYGEYEYILSILTAALLFMNMGTEQAYFTFIAKKKQHFKFHLYYFSWQFLQIVFLFLFIISINKDAYHFIFKDVKIDLVIIALVALFFSGNIQNSINHMVESIRKTNYTMILSIIMALLHLVLILIFLNANILNIKILFQVVLFEYILYAFIILFLFKNYRFEIFSNDKFSFIEMVGKFYIYSKPLFLLAIFVFIYTFIDRWIIQTYIGAKAQAYFAISMKFSTLTILITSSILKIFWKEISESIERGDIEKTKKYFKIVSENLFVFTTVVSSTLFFFSDSILNYFYSDTYQEASLVFKLIMLYPIFQSMGQLYASFCYASAQTKLYSNVAYFTLTFGIIISMVILSNFALKIGIVGFAIKLLIMSCLSVLILEYHILKFLQVKTNHLYKGRSVVMIFSMSYLVYLTQVWFNFPFLVQVLLVSCLYVVPVGVYLFKVLKKELNI